MGARARAPRSWRVVSAVLILLAAACARMAPPGGGPEDQEAPRVTAHLPDSGATRVPCDAALELQFSEGMDHSAVSDWLLIAPWPGRLTSRWSGNVLRVVPSDGWSAGTTYAVLLGVDAWDRRHNRLAAPLLFAFSTGDTLARGRVRGRVHTRALKAEGTNVFLFEWPAQAEPPLPAEAPLRPDPLRALRLAQAGKEGAFELPFVPTRVAYLVGALYDRNGNRFYDEGEDLWSFAPLPVVCPDTGDGVAAAEVYLVYADEKGDLLGTVQDPACAGYVPPHTVRALADSLGQILSGERDALGFPVVTADSLPGAQLTVAAAESLRAAITRAEAAWEVARSESVRCSASFWVSARVPGDSLAAGEVRASGTFQLEDLAPGRYTLSAFRDVNGNARPEADEPAGLYPSVIDLLPGHRVEGLEWAVAVDSAATAAP